MSSCGDVSPPVQVRVNHGAQPVSVGNVEVLDPGSDAVPNARVTFPYRLLAGLDALRSRGGFYGRGIYMAEYARCPPDLCPHPMPFPPPHASARLATSSPPLCANTPACVRVLRACPCHPPIIMFTGLPSGTPQSRGMAPPLLWCWLRRPLTRPAGQQAGGSGVPDSAARIVPLASRVLDSQPGCGCKVAVATRGNAACVLAVVIKGALNTVGPTVGVECGL